VQQFDRGFEVEIRGEDFSRNWSAAPQSNGIFNDGYFHVEEGGALKTFNIIENTDSSIVLKGKLGKRLSDFKRFLITLYDPNQVNLNFTSEGYKELKSKLKKDGISVDGSIVYKPIAVTIETNKTTEIEAGIRDTNKRFGGVSKTIEIAGETLFDFTGVSENLVRIYGYIEAEPSAAENTSAQKIPLSVGGPNLDVVIVPKDLQGKVLFLDVYTASPSENVRAVINRSDGTSETVQATKSITNKRHIIKIDQNVVSFINIQVLFDPERGSSLDIVGVLDDEVDVGISLQNDVITKTGFKALNFDELNDKFNFSGFEGLRFTDIDLSGETYKHRFASKSFLENFVNSAMVHTVSDNFWEGSTTPSLFTPAYKIDNTKIEENSWVKNGSENIINFIKYKNAGGIDLRLNQRFSFQNSFNRSFTTMKYVNRGNDLDNLVIMYRLNLNHLLDFLPETLVLPKEDFTTEEKTNYEEQFRNFASNNFFFVSPTGANIGIGSSDLLNGAGGGANVGNAVIYPIGYSAETGLPIRDIITSLQHTGEEIDTDIKVATKETSTKFILERSDKAGAIIGNIYFPEGTFTAASQSAVGLVSDDYMHPFIGHSEGCDTIFYGVGVNKLKKHHGYEFGIFLEYVEY
jgi:hypothetical protein